MPPPDLPAPFGGSGVLGAGSSPQVLVTVSLPLCFWKISGQPPSPRAAGGGASSRANQLFLAGSATAGLDGKLYCLRSFIKRPEMGVGVAVFRRQLAHGPSGSLFHDSDSVGGHTEKSHPPPVCPPLLSGPGSRRSLSFCRVLWVLLAFQRLSPGARSIFQGLCSCGGVFSAKTF